MANVYLTTVDNKIDPSSDFTAWWHEDTCVLGHDTCGKIARVAQMLGYDDKLSDEKKDAIVEDAIDQLVENDFLNMYRKIKKEDS